MEDFVFKMERSHPRVRPIEESLFRQLQHHKIAHTEGCRVLAEVVLDMRFEGCGDDEVRREVMNILDWGFSERLGLSPKLRNVLRGIWHYT